MRIVERNVYVGPSLHAHFDHCICRRDNSLRGRASDEVSQMVAAELRDQGVADSAITLIPDEQEAIDAALRMGQPGDLLLVFAGALTRSWKQVIKFKPEAATSNPARAAALSSPPAVPAEAATRADSADASLEAAAPDDAEPLSSGFVRDERGLRFVGEATD